MVVICPFTASLHVVYPDLTCLSTKVCVLTNWHLHRSTRVNSPYHLGEQVSSLLCNDLFTRVER